MIFDNYIASVLLNKNWAINNIKILLRSLHFITNTCLYFFVFKKINNSIIGIFIFIAVILFFEIIRTQKLSIYLQHKK